MTKELLQQALEALEEASDLVNEQLVCGIVMYSRLPSRQHRIAAYRKQAEAHMAAIVALKAALAQPVEPAPAAPHEPDAYVEGGRESVEDALAVIESFGPGTAGVNDTFARQILLAEEVRRLRSLYESATKGRGSFRLALRAARLAAENPIPQEGTHE